MYAAFLKVVAIDGFRWAHTRANMLAKPIILAVRACAILPLVFQSASGSPLSSRAIDAANVTSSVAWTPVGAEPNGTAAMQALVERRLPASMHSIFDFILDPTLNTTTQAGYDAFIVDTGNTTTHKITISSATTPGLSRGLLTYLRSRGGDIYWSGDTFTEELLSASLSNDTVLTGSSWASIRYLFNVVTYSYTMAFYDFEQWSYLLDWASLHGVNLPLAVGGQEYIWAEVYRDMGLPEADVLAYFSGPAFESWFRMGNIHGSWGQNVTQSWLDQQWTLQKQIISRMVALGMTPVLPAFNGFVPKALQSYVGGEPFLNASNWEGFPVEYTNNSAIDPTYSSWGVMQTAFLEKQQALYGGWTSHYYSIDLYNELTPPSLDLTYLKNNTQSVVSSLRAVDDQAIWVMQGWLFVSDTADWNETTIEALLSGAEDDEMLVLDLASEAIPAWNSTQSFYGKNWVWNTLFDYGQNQGFYGSLTHYTSEVIRAKENSTTLVGTGLTMEGMNQNELVFELALDSPWSTEVIDPSSWTREFITRRYGLGVGALSAGGSDAQEAWALLIASAYNSTDASVQGVIKSPLELVPAITGIVNKTGHHPTKLTYQPATVVAALDKLISAVAAAPALEFVDAFSYDLVDTTRQVLLNAGIPIYENLLAAWNATNSNASEVAAIGATLVDLLDDIDEVLATNRNFLLSKWVSDARIWANSEAEKAWMEYEARNQIILWGTANTIPWALDRYASKQWHGVVSDVYGKGWQMFTNYLLDTEPSSFNQTAWNAQLQTLEFAWQAELWGQSDGQTWSTVGDVVSTVIGLRQKWSSYL